MAQQTTNLHLTKPDLTDFADVRVLNQNFDILDEKVQAALDKEPDLSGLMPKSGGNFTGDITIQDHAVVYPIEVIDHRDATNVFNTTKNEHSQDDINGDYYRIVKYSDGTMILDACYSVQYNDLSGNAKRITFPAPFANDKLFVQCSSLDQNEDGYYTNYVTARVDKTGMYIYNNYNTEDRLMVRVIGNWK